MSVIITWTLGDRLRKSRQVAGLSQAEMGQELGVVAGTISRMEADAQIVRRSYLLTWAMRTGVSYEWLRDEESPPEPAPEPTHRNGRRRQVAQTTTWYRDSQNRGPELARLNRSAA